MLQNQLSFNADQRTVTQVVANLGAMTGGTVVGFLSQTFGRRLSIIVICIIGGALLYPYTFVYSQNVIAAAFFQQFCVQGAWGVIPIHLMELSPGAFRTFVVGTSYQLGNLVSSASSTIEATIGERFPLPAKDGTPRYNYGKVICIFMGCVYAYVIILTVSLIIIFSLICSPVFFLCNFYGTLIGSNRYYSSLDRSTFVANLRSRMTPMFVRSPTRKQSKKPFTGERGWAWASAMKT